MSVLLQLDYRCCELGDVWGFTSRAVRSDGCAGRRVRLRVRASINFGGGAAGRRSNDQFGGGLQSQVEHRIIGPSNGPPQMGLARTPGAYLFGRP